MNQNFYIKAPVNLKFIRACIVSKIQKLEPNLGEPKKGVNFTQNWFTYFWFTGALYKNDIKF
jgi:hypothetical protein